MLRPNVDYWSAPSDLNWQDPIDWSSNQARDLIGLWWPGSMVGSPGLDLAGRHWTTRGGGAGDAFDARMGHVYALDGDGDYLVATSTAALDITGSFLISCWANMTSYPSFSPLLVGRSGSFLGYGIYWEGSGLGGGNVVKGLKGTGYDYSTTSPGYQPAVNTWHHYALSYDQATLQFWVDGAVLASNAYSDPVAISPSNVYLGCHSSVMDPGWFFPGYLTDCRIYRSARRDIIPVLADPAESRQILNVRPQTAWHTFDRSFSIFDNFTVTDSLPTFNVQHTMQDTVTVMDRIPAPSIVLDRPTLLPPKTRPGWKPIRPRPFGGNP